LAVYQAIGAELGRPTPPSGPRDPNTLYAGTLPPDQTQPVELIYRVYVPDKERDLSGDGGLPEGTLVLADGATLAGQAACDALQLSTAFPSPSLMPVATYLQLTHLPPNPAIGAPGSGPEAPAVDPATWYAAFNSCHLTARFFQAAGYPVQACPNTRAVTQWGEHRQPVHLGRHRPPFRTGARRAQRRRPAGEAAGHPGHLPTSALFPERRRHALLVDLPDRAAGDHPDGELRLRRAGAGGRRRVLPHRHQRPEDRPRNATGRCGVQWLPWSPQGDGVPAPDTKPTAALLIIRNMLPDPSFAQAIQNVPAPGLPVDVQATMGDYAPTIASQSRAEFEARGCDCRRHWH
jgi:hypothetical protein